MYSVLTVLVLTMYRCTMYIVLSLTVKCRISYSVPAWYLRVLFLTVGTAFPPLAVRMGSFYTQSWVICAVMDILFYICVWWAWLSSTIFPALRPKFPCTPSKISLYSVQNFPAFRPKFPALRPKFPSTPSTIPCTPSKISLHSVKKNRVLKILFKNFNCCLFCLR